MDPAIVEKSEGLIPRTYLQQAQQARHQRETLV